MQKEPSFTEYVRREIHGLEVVIADLTRQGHEHGTLVWIGHHSDGVWLTPVEAVDFSLAVCQLIKSSLNHKAI